MVLVAQQAFLHADALNEVYVKPTHLHNRERCWLLKNCMYGWFFGEALDWLSQKLNEKLELVQHAR